MNTPSLSSKLALSVVFLLFTAVGCGETPPASDAPAAAPKKAGKGSKVPVSNEDYDSLPSRPTPFTATQGTPSKDAPTKEAPKVEKPSDKEKGASTGDAILYDFQAEWCGPCKKMDPLVQSLINRGYPIKQIDVDANRSLAARYGVNGIPCFVLVVNGQEVDRVVGMVPLSRLERMFTKNNISPIQ